jgi:DNA-binding NtrC family response regulator
VGKAFFARYLHSHSSRRDHPLTTVDCRAPQSLDLASFLEGEKGEALLLRHADALSGHRTQGPSRQDVRLIATGTAVESPMFKGAIRIPVPSLADRQEDLPVLFALFASNRIDAGCTLDSEALVLLSTARWPGNVQNLRLLAERLSWVYPGQVITRERLPPDLRGEVAAASGASLHQNVAALEREAIARALERAGGRKIRAAQLLGISRPTLDKKIAEYGLAVEKRR